MRYNHSNHGLIAVSGKTRAKMGFLKTVKRTTVPFNVGYWAVLEKYRGWNFITLAHTSLHVFYIIFDANIYITDCIFDQPHYTERIRLESRMCLICMKPSQ